MISASTINLNDWKSATDPTCVFAFEDGQILGALPPTPQRKPLIDSAKTEGFKASLGQCAAVTFAAKAASRKYLLVGLGKKQDYSNETLRRAAGCAYPHAKSRWAALSVSVPAADSQAAAEGLLLASYAFSEYRKPEPEKLGAAKLIVENAGRPTAERALAKAALYCEAVCLTRDLVNRGPSDKTPQSLAQLARALKAPGLNVKVIERSRAQQLGMGSFLGVARGSSVEPVFLHLAYKPKQRARKIGLVGKGITFDSGGLSLKPPASMETMKMDMARAASILSVFKVLPRLKPRAEIHGFCAITYNMPGPDAMKPGDVIKAMNGKTIEVLNTDAEGRLVLADALAYACRQKLDCIIDLATLTGAVVTALGSKVTAAMTNDKALLRQLLAAAAKTDENFCELPLVRDYKEQIKSSIADLQNIGKARSEAGSIIGGLFLEEFVDGKPWVHLDIAGTAWNDSASSYCPVGGTGSVVRTILEYLS